MKKTFLASMAALVFMSIISTGSLFAQGDKKPASPPATATGKIKDATITINYSSPSVRGRKIWGGLVPYDTVWRAGANAATIFETTKDIEVEGKKLPAGKYSLFATPGQNGWTFYFNSQTGQWGEARGGGTNMDPKKTVLAVKVKSKEESTVQESMLFTIIDKDLEKGFELRWDKLSVFVSVK